MRDRDRNRHHRERRAKYTRILKAVQEQHPGVSDDRTAFFPMSNCEGPNNVTGRARNREVKNFGPLESRSERRRMALDEATDISRE